MREHSQTDSLRVELVAPAAASTVRKFLKLKSAREENIAISWPDCKL
jgi:hypothetical protein